MWKNWKISLHTRFRIYLQLLQLPSFFLELCSILTGGFLQYYLYLLFQEYWLKVVCLKIIWENIPDRIRAATPRMINKIAIKTRDFILLQLISLLKISKIILYTRRYGIADKVVLIILNIAETISFILCCPESFSRNFKLFI